MKNIKKERSLGRRKNTFEKNNESLLGFARSPVYSRPTVGSDFEWNRPGQGPRSPRKIK